LRYTDPSGQFVNNIALNPNTYVMVAMMVSPEFAIGYMGFLFTTGYDPVNNRQLSGNERTINGILAGLGLAGKVIGFLGRAAAASSDIFKGARIGEELGFGGRSAAGAIAGDAERLAAGAGRLEGEGAAIEGLAADAVAAEKAAIGRVGYGDSALSREVQNRRLELGDRGGNRAAATLEDGGILRGRSSAAMHAEEDILGQAGGRRITSLFSEFEPCANTCAPLLEDVEDVTWSWDWNPPDVRDASRAARTQAIRDLFR
jgi:hypothetical protein